MRALPYFSLFKRVHVFDDFAYNLRKCNLIITMEQSLKSLILNRCFATIQESNNISLASSEACYGIIISKSCGIYRLF